MIKTILFDFDGVIMDSLSIKNDAFSYALRKYPKKKIEELIKYHQKNGGLSRYHKFSYFLKNIMQVKTKQDILDRMSEDFAWYVSENLFNKDLLISETVEFIRANKNDYSLHIVSGSDGEELRILCSYLNIDKYFISIVGSPTPKSELVAAIMAEYNYTQEETLLIGDSIHDCDAARANNIKFMGYNNDELRQAGEGYIESFKDLRLPAEK